MAYYSDPHTTLHHGDCLEVMAGMPADSVDAIVTDPPYGLSFMGSAWDHGVPGGPFWAEMLRVAKPGAYLLSFGGTRTVHRIATAIEDVGWEIRDMLAWCYAEGFPKGPDVGRQIDMELCTQPGRHWMRQLPIESKRQPDDHVCAETEEGRPHYGESTTLKPAWEPIVMARKPMRGTVAGNVRSIGTGALQIDATRLPIAPDDEINTAVFTVRPSAIRDGTTGFVSSNVVGDRLSTRPTRRSTDRTAARADKGPGGYSGGWPEDGPARPWPRSRAPQSDPAKRTGTVGRDLGFSSSSAEQMHAAQQRSTEALEELGRWPANVVLTDPIFDGGFHGVEGGGSSPPRGNTRPSLQGRSDDAVTYGGGWARRPEGYPPHDEPSWATYSRFFLIPKATRDERERGLTMPDGSRANLHPTVKPNRLMRHLVRLVTPPGGTVLDPFLGSGTTALAASEEGRQCIGIEQQEEYLVTSVGRLTATPIGLGL